MKTVNTILYMSSLVSNESMGMLTEVQVTLWKTYHLNTRMTTQEWCTIVISSAVCRQLCHHGVFCLLPDACMTLCMVVCQEVA